MSEPVVELREMEPGIIQVKMQDRVHKNAFSEGLIQGLISAFEVIQNNSQYKVVILTGYDSYFASGGTQEGLLNIQQGKTKFTDDNIYSLALDCKIPVIAAMQGHGIGGGFVMGLFADFVVLSRESIYTTNFMKYGFTPGMGGTFIVPQKLGFSLGQELLMNAGNYRGADLEKRGVPYPVLPRQEVMGYALELARELAEKPRHSLITLKDHLVAPLREQLPRVIEQELIMHEKTFHQAEVKERITQLYGS
ncbi:polyketide synthase [Brevibacillus dissolubilis]|uniref:polyketide synthase n=1 Tax=Brevibacillus dissolubilis TaxID=1844116 RepID=UPI001116841A|nr:polyketide synthase [Brevibacillus dissolubilis]